MLKSRRFRRKSRFAFAAAVAAIAATAAVIVATESLSTWIGVTLGMVCMGTAILLFVLGGMSAYAARRFAEIERGEGVVARWIVDPETWRERQAQRRKLDAQPGVVPTFSDILSAKAPPEGIEVVVCEGYIHVTPDTWLWMSKTTVQASAADAWLTMEWDSEDGGTELSVRLPLPRNGQIKAERVIRYFDRLRGQQ